MTNNFDLSYLKKLGKLDKKSRNFYMQNMAIFVAAGLFLLLMLFYPISVKFDLWELLIILGVPVIVMGYFSLDIMRFHSPVFATPLHHSSLSRLGPWKDVSIINYEGKKMEYSIFDIGGIAMEGINISGGGKDGYYIVPKGAWFVEGGSIYETYIPVRFNYDQLPERLREELRQHKKFKLSSPIWWCLFPPTISKKILNTISDGFAEKTSQDIITLLKMAEEHAYTSNNTRKIEREITSGLMSKKKTRREFATVTEEERDLEEERR